MDAVALLPSRRSALMPILLAVTLAGAFELSNQLLEYVRKEFGAEAEQRLDNWQRLHLTDSSGWSIPFLTGSVF